MILYQIYNVQSQWLWFLLWCPHEWFIYNVGNAVTTVKSKDQVKVFTVRGTAFEAAESDGSGVPNENGK